MKKIRSIATTGVASLGLVLGMAGFAGASTGTIDTTGPDSWNKIKHVAKSKVRMQNNNNLSASNSNHQNATTGSANTSGNTTGGSARSGDARNTNALNASVSVANSGVSGGMAGGSGMTSHSGTIRNTGPDSYNSVKTVTKSYVEVENNNNLTVTNTNDQTASSGSANVSGNTTGGSATSGDATNTNSTTIRFDVEN